MKQAKCIKAPGGYGLDIDRLVPSSGLNRSIVKKRLLVKDYVLCKITEQHRDGSVIISSANSLCEML